MKTQVQKPPREAKLPPKSKEMRFKTPPTVKMPKPHLPRKGEAR